MSKKKVKKLFISDLHLGSSHCREEVILEALQEYDFEQLVIVGDLFERDAVLCGEQIKIVDFFFKNRHKIICLDGNHDPKSDGKVAKLLGIKVREEYAFKCGGKKFIVLHGHRFDKICFVFDEPLVDKLFLLAVKFFKRFSVLGYSLKRWMNVFHDGFSRRIAKKAVKYAAKRGKDIVICGHTHQEDHSTFECKGKTIDYWNCGDWAGILTMDEDGNIESRLIHAYEAIV